MNLFSKYFLLLIIALCDIYSLTAKDFNINNYYDSANSKLGFYNLVIVDSTHLFNISQKFFSSSDAGKNWSEWDYGFYTGNQLIFDLSATANGNLFFLINVFHAGIIRVNEQKADTIKIDSLYGDLIETIAMKNNEVGLIGLVSKGTFATSLLKTTDGGSTWNEAFFPKDFFPKYYIYSIDYKNDSIYAFVSVVDTLTEKQHTELIYSLDDGKTWNGPVNLSMIISVWSKKDHSYQIMGKNIWAVEYFQGDDGIGHSNIEITTDFGETWNQVFSDSLNGRKYLISNISMLNSKVGVASSINQLIYTEDGGNTWIPLIENGSDVIDYSYFNKPDHVLIFGSNNIHELVFLPSDVGDNENEKNDLSIAPNPVSESMTLKINRENIENIRSIELINNTGNLIFSNENLSQKSFHLDTSKFLSGLYFVKIQIGNKLYIKKVIIQH